MYLGVDVASVDGNKLINWAATHAAGCQYAIFRGTYDTWVDPTWKLEADRARATGMTIGAYLFPVMAVGAPSPEDQVAAFSKSIGQLSGMELPPTLDVEFPGGIAKTGRTRPELLTWIRTAIAELKKTYRAAPMVYTSARVWDGDDDDSLNVDGLGVPVPEILECPLWLARYPFKTHTKIVTQGAEVDALQLPPVPKAWGDSSNVWIHQYQGDAIDLPGFSSTTDLNRFFDLAKGAKGERVRWLQRKLKISEDGDFGPDTHQAVVRFQRTHQLTADGIVGPKTFAALCWAT